MLLKTIGSRGENRGGLLQFIRSLRGARKGQAIKVRWSEGRRSYEPAVPIFLNPHDLKQELWSSFCGKSPTEQAQRERRIGLRQRSKMYAAT